MKAFCKLPLNPGCIEPQIKRTYVFMVIRAGSAAYKSIVAPWGKIQNSLREKLEEVVKY